MQTIFIQRSIIDYLAIPDTPSTSCVITDNAIGEITTRIADAGDKPLHAMIFTRIDEYERLRYFLKDFNFRDLLYTIVLIDPDNVYGLNHYEKLAEAGDYRNSPISEKECAFLIRHGFNRMTEAYEKRVREEAFLMQLIDTKHDQEDLINIGRSLSLEKDPDKLLRSILFLSKRITGADAGSIFMVEESEDGDNKLRFKYSHTFSKDIPIEEFTIPLNTRSIAGYVAVTGKALNIPDVYEIPADSPFSFNSSFDREQNYRSKSMLAVPMVNHVDKVIGVVQLINSKEYVEPDKKITGNEAFEIRLETPDDFDTKVVAFDPRYNGLLESVASQAAIAIENNRMIKQIENQFEEFVRASVLAIESRDAATSGHSFRVAEICTAMAHAINAEKEGAFAEITFSEKAIKELEYASLLHDFGKVYIDLSIFMKEKKLFPKDLENVILKFNLLYKLIEFPSLASPRRDTASEPKPDDRDNRREINARLDKIREIIDEIRKLNEPTVTDMDPETTINNILSEINDIDCVDVEGNRVQVLDEQEAMNLRIKRGSLNPVERHEIESHVVHTYNFVSKIPWPPEFRNIPEIALKHHEKLDGTGYPSGICGADIPLQARMIAIADIYDALAAADRPYKKAVPTERAIAILKDEADKKKIDKDLVDLFLKNKIFEKISMGTLS